MRPLFRVLTLALATTAAAPAATAQTKPTPPPAPAPARPQPPATRPVPRPMPRPAMTAANPIGGFVSFGAGAQVTSSDFRETHSEPLYAEQKTWTADYNVKTGLEFEVGGGWRVWRHLFAAATYSRFHDARAVDVSAQIPHPFFFNQPRSISGQSDKLSHDENAVHLSAYWMVPAGRRFEVAVFGGPSIIAVSRGLVKDVQYSETYPYDTATFVAAPGEDASKTAVGVHVGADVTWLVKRQFGVGGSVRYTRASVDLDTPSGGSVSFDAGGLQAAATLKVWIRRKPAARIPARPTPPRNAPSGTTPPRTQVPIAGAIGTAITIADAPLFLRPDATLTPLRRVPTGTRLRILDQTSDWVHIDFDDPQFGRRVGYVQRALVRLETGR